MNKIKVELISIGNELLSGRTLNTHARDLGKSLFSIGLDLMRDTTIGDNIDLIKDVTKSALERSSIVFISGGLGPTVDDITRDALSDLFDCSIKEDPKLIKELKSWYEKKGRKLNSIGIRQAQILDGAIVIPNPIGAAPAQKIMYHKEKVCYVLPGPPNEFNAILNNYILPELKSKFPNLTPKAVRSIKTRGIGESDIVEIMQKNNVYIPTTIETGFYPAQGRVEIRLTAESNQRDALEDSNKKLKSIFSDWLEKAI